MTNDVALGEGREFDLIRALRVRWGPLASGIGDDAAVLRVPRGEQLVVSTDTALEGVHFRRDWLSLREIGYRAVTAALSDLAAMAASPRGVLVSLQLSKDARGQIDDLADGIGDAARRASTVIVGGNVAHGDSLAITTTVLGNAFTPVTRASARPGNLLYVTGRLGGPAIAIAALEKGKKPAPAARERFARPDARITEARWLAARGMTSAIDISDGLAADARHVAAASGVVMEIEVERLALFDGATSDDALRGGDEYELLLTARAPLPDVEFAERFGFPLTQIGRVSTGEPDVHVLRGGKRVASPPGYDHLSR